MPDKIITENDALALRSLGAKHALAFQTDYDSWLAGLRLAETTPMPPPDVPVPPKTGWNVGVWAAHDMTMAKQWFAWINRSIEKRSHVTAFVTHDRDEASMANNWWMTAIPIGRGLSLRIPLVPAGDPDFKKDRTATFRRIAQQAALVDQHALICPAWEMNLSGWPSHVNPGNIRAWKDAWKRCYDALKSEVPTLIIGFNANGGDINATGADLRAVMDGLSFDVAGPDQYDCWPGDLDAATRSTMLTRAGGLNWWADYTKDRGVGLIVPEWGVSSGSQWKGHTGGDSSRYIQTMYDYFKRNPHLTHESYFNEPAGYVASDILRLGSKSRPTNPKASVTYQELWRDLP